MSSTLPTSLDNGGGRGLRMGPESGGAIEYLSDFEPFNSRLCNKHENLACRTDLGDINYGLVR